MAKRKQLSLIDLEAMKQAAECLKVIAHPWRLRMIQIMLADRQMVSELAEACDIAPNRASEHLRLMQRAGLLESEREGMAGPGSVNSNVRSDASHREC